MNWHGPPQHNSNSMRKLMGALEADRALFFYPDGRPILECGWAWQYANVAITFVNDAGLYSLQLRGREGTPIESDDVKDLYIIAKRAGLSLVVTDNVIEFKEE